VCVELCSAPSALSRKHRILSLQICVRQTVRLTIEFVDWRRNVCTLCKTPVCDTSKLKQRLIDTWACISQNVTDEAVGQWKKRLRASMSDKRTSLWTSAKLNPTHFTTGYFQINQQSTDENTLFPSQLFKANQVSKRETRRNVEYAYHFWKCADWRCLPKKILKLVDARQNYSLPKLAHVWDILQRK